MIGTLTASTNDSASRSSTFGMLLRRHRTAAGLTQVRLAERSGYYVNYVRKLERGERRPSVQVMGALAEALRLSAADRVLFERVARGGVPAEPPIVGREREIRLLEAHLDRNELGFLLLSGEPGIGKTRLLAEAKRMAMERGALVLEATCRTESSSMYAPFREALERPLWAMPQEGRVRSLDGCEPLSHLIAESIGVTFPIRSVEPPERHQQLLFEAVTRFLSRLATGRSIVLLLDDLQEADSGTLDLLRRLLLRSELPLHVVGACRDLTPGLNDAVSAMIGRGTANGIPLQPLTPQPAHALLGELLGNSVGSAVQEDLVRRSAGVPGWLIALAAGPLNGPVPPELAADIVTRVRSLPAGGLETLQTLAVAGCPLPVPAIAAAIDAPLESLEAALRAACSQGLLRAADGDKYDCRCGVIAEVISAEMPPALKDTLRHRLAPVKRADGTCNGTTSEPRSEHSPPGITPVPMPGWCTGT